LIHTENVAKIRGVSAYSCKNFYKTSHSYANVIFQLQKGARFSEFIGSCTQGDWANPIGATLAVYLRGNIYLVIVPIRWYMHQSEI